MLVELKNGETLNGHLVNCDTYMNLTLKEVVQTSPEGDKFFRLPECYVRGNNVGFERFLRAEVTADKGSDQVSQSARRDCGFGEGSATGSAIAARWPWRDAAER